jgi:hypothetical protein
MIGKRGLFGEKLAHRRNAVLGLVGLASVGFSRVAPAADAACFDSYEQAQRLRKDGKLVDARAQAAICAADGCPAMLKKDCKQWVAEIAKSIPTVTFRPTDEHGQDVVVAAVYVDDRKVADSIDGRPVPLDPGPHRFRFESGDRKTEVTVDVAAGESNRAITATLEPSPPPAPPPSASRRIPRVSLVLGSVAGVGLVSFVSFAVAGRVQQGCSPVCQPGQISAMRTEYAIADVSWITGLAALGGAIAFWVAQPSVPSADVPPPKAGTLRFEANPAPGGASFGLGGSF